MNLTPIKMPAAYAAISEEELCYLQGGSDNDAWTTILNIGKTFSYIAYIFAGMSSIINNVNTINNAFINLNDILSQFGS